MAAGQGDPRVGGATREGATREGGVPPYVRRVNHKHHHSAPTGVCRTHLCPPIRAVVAVSRWRLPCARFYAVFTCGVWACPSRGGSRGDNSPTRVRPTRTGEGWWGLQRVVQQRVEVEGEGGRVAWRASGTCLDSSSKQERVETEGVGGRKTDPLPGGRCCQDWLTCADKNRVSVGVNPSLVDPTAATRDPGRPSRDDLSPAQASSSHSRGG